MVYDAIEAARARGHDVVIVDTAGRLHTQQHLMDELRKVRKVIERQAPGAPHETLLTIDATTGQNGLRQALLFREAVDVTGIVLTKLDGTAKGGIALAIAQELGVPVKLIGIGEALEDLRPFDPDDFARRSSSRERAGRRHARGTSRAARARAGRAVPARPGVRGAVPPQRRPGRLAVRLHALRQSDLDALRGRGRRASRTPRRCCSPRAWPPRPRCC